MGRTIAQYSASVGWEYGISNIDKMDNINVTDKKTIPFTFWALFA